MTVIVTGAAGLLGSAVARELGARGTPVLTADYAPAAPGTRSRHITWDLRGPVPDDVAALAPRVRTVVHCGRMSADWGEPDEFHAVNVSGTRAVLDTFPRARFIHLSTTAVYGTGRDHSRLYEEGGPLDESEYTDSFALSAARAEHVVSRVRPEALVLRPARMYAPGEADGVIDTLERFRTRDTLRLPGGAKNSAMLAHVDNVVGAVLAGIERPHVSGPVNVADPQPYVLRDALMTYLARTDRPAVTIDSGPADLAKARAWLRAKRAGKPRHDNRPAHTVTEIDEFVRERTYDLSRLGRLLGFAPAQRLAPGS